MAATSSSSSICALAATGARSRKDWGAWSGRPIIERPRPGVGSSCAAPGDRQGPCREAQAHGRIFRGHAAQLRSRQGRGARAYATVASASMPSTARSRAAMAGRTPPRKTHDDIERQFQPASRSMASCPGPTSVFASTPSRPAMRPISSPMSTFAPTIRPRSSSAWRLCVATWAIVSPTPSLAAMGLHFYDQRPRAQLERIFGVNEDGSLARTSTSSIGRARRGRPLRQRHAVDHRVVWSETQRRLPAVSIHPLTLKPYRRARR